MEAVENSWLPGPDKAKVLDVGCGHGEVAAWFRSRGYEAVGIDISEVAIREARNRVQDENPAPEFHVVDISTHPPPGGHYGIVIDRGCLHSIPSRQQEGYLKNLTSVLSPDARLILFHSAYRGGRPWDDPADKARIRRMVEDALESEFAVERVESTWLDIDRGTRAETARGGLVFWLVRRPP